MAAQATAIADIIEPKIWSRYFVELTTAKNALIDSGIMGSTPEIDAAVAKGGRTIEMPFWDDLPNNVQGTTDISKLATDTDDLITAKGLSTDYDLAVKQYRTMDFQVSPVIYTVAGEDPAKVVIDRYATWWKTELQRLLLLELKGVFSNATTAAALSLDISGDVVSTDPNVLISTNAVERARFLLGDAYNKFTAILVHSAVLFNMRNLDMVVNVPVSQQNPLDGVKPTYMGLDVIVDDNITKTATGDSLGYKYVSYLFGKGAIAFANIPQDPLFPEIELFRSPKAGTGAGMLDIITRRQFILHPRGFRFGASVSGVTPTDAQLYGDNYTQCFLTKNCRIARLITNG